MNKVLKMVCIVGILIIVPIMLVSNNVYAQQSADIEENLRKELLSDNNEEADEIPEDEEDNADDDADDGADDGADDDADDDSDGSTKVPTTPATTTPPTTTDKTEKKQEEKKVEEVEEEKLPQTGEAENYLLIAAVCVFGGIAVFSYIKNKKI